MMISTRKRPSLHALLSPEAARLLRFVQPAPAGPGWSLGRLCWGLPWQLCTELLHGEDHYAVYRPLPRDLQSALREIMRSGAVEKAPRNPNRLVLNEAHRRHIVLHQAQAAARSR
jgi:hypothetical protein